MVILKNGRGQLGDELIKANLQCNQDVYIYHTWEVNDKHPNAQYESLKRFKYFVDEHKSSRIIFISTTSENETQYVLTKHTAEAYLINTTSNGFVLRVPMFIGPRVISNFKDDSKLRALGWKPKRVFQNELPYIVDYYKDKFIW